MVVTLNPVHDRVDSQKLRTELHHQILREVDLKSLLTFDGSTGTP
jgi:hypothetical protein